MKKNVLIITAVLILIVIALLIYAHKVPIWVSLSNIISILSGLILGWITRVLYAKYVLKDNNSENDE